MFMQSKSLDNPCFYKNENLIGNKIDFDNVVGYILHFKMTRTDKQKEYAKKYFQDNKE